MATRRRRRKTARISRRYTPDEIQEFHVVQRLRATEFQDLKQVYRNSGEVAAENFASIIALARMNGWGISSISEKYHLGRAVVLDKTATGEMPECWAFVDDADHRPIYEQYLERFRGTFPGYRLPTFIEVDHVFPRVMAHHAGMAYVRLALSYSRANGSNGSREREWGKNYRSSINALSDKPDHPTLSVSGTNLQWRKIWSPTILKYLPRFIRPPLGRMSPLQVLEILRYLHQKDVLPTGSLDYPFSIELGSYRQYAAGIPHYHAQMRSHAEARDAAGRTLSGFDTLGAWLTAGPLVEIATTEDWVMAAPGSMAFGEAEEDEAE